MPSLSHDKISIIAVLVQVWSDPSLLARTIRGDSASRGDANR